MSFPNIQRVTLVAVMASFVVLTAAGCAARKSALVESKDLVAVTVMPAGTRNWLYTVETKNAEYLTSVEFISPDLEGCRVLALPEEAKITQQTTPDGIRVNLWGRIYGDRYTQFRRLRLILASDTPKSRGKINIRVTDFSGNTTTIESIAGPVAARIGTPRYAWQRNWRSYEVMPQHFGRFPDNLVRINSIGN